jgi:exonuclease III
MLIRQVLVGALLILMSTGTPATEPYTLASWNLEWLGATTSLTGRTAKEQSAIRKQCLTERQQHPSAQPSKLCDKPPRLRQDYRKLAKYARQLKADIIAVQEVNGPAAAQRVFGTGYQYRFTSRRHEQNVGFAVRRGIEIVRFEDYAALDQGNVRYGADLTVKFPDGQMLRLLAVHLKSGCFTPRLDTPESELHGKEKEACPILRKQLPKLEEWIDARASEEIPFAVVGDFNRRLTAEFDKKAGYQDKSNLWVWPEISDGVPPEADLVSASGTQHPQQCGFEMFDQFIDYIVASKSLAGKMVPGSFHQTPYVRADYTNYFLSDHCPISAMFNL